MPFLALQVDTVHLSSQVYQVHQIAKDLLSSTRVDVLHPFWGNQAGFQLGNMHLNKLETFILVDRDTALMIAEGRIDSVLNMLDKSRQPTQAAMGRP